MGGAGWEHHLPTHTTHLCTQWEEHDLKGHVEIYLTQGHTGGKHLPALHTQEEFYPCRENTHLFSFPSSPLPWQGGTCTWCLCLERDRHCLPWGGCLLERPGMDTSHLLP